MPRENPNGDQLPNPSKYFYSWSGDNGHFTYYDKETKKNVVVEISAKKPFVFLALDVLSTIKGFCEADKSGFWANEVRDIQKEILTVKTGQGTKAIGLYADIKDKIKAAGGKFSVSIYGGMKGPDGKLEIVNIQMYGAALNAWIDFAKANKVYESAVVIRSSEEKKKGKIVWFVPVLEATKVKPETDDEAAELQKELKVYHSAYFARNTSTVAETDHKSAEKSQNKPVKQHGIEENESLIIDPLDLDDDDLPF